ncbi:MAG: hypothetical protein DRN06_08720 [Thermoprotei archaeon]|nr:MAG: hypothetical protein DRN06_08720 [Thermoprotei archaeon]
MVNAVEYGVVIPARNEEKFIGLSIESLLQQSVKPLRIVVVDDSSVDKTALIAEKLGATVVRVRREFEGSLSGTPYIALLINKGFEDLEGLELDYVMVSGADSIYPNYYVEELARRMRRDGAVIASGVAVGEETSEYGVRGSGRLVDANWFRHLGFRYPLCYGFEAWLILKALSEGFGVKVYRDLKFRLLRPTRISVRKAYLWGKAMRSLNYWWPYAIARSLKFLIRSPPIGVNMVAGFLSSTDSVRDLKGFTERLQKAVTIGLVKSYVSRLTHSSCERVLNTRLE